MPAPPIKTTCPCIILLTPFLIFQIPSLKKGGSKLWFLTRNLPFDSDIRQWRHPLMVLLHFLLVKSSIWKWHDLVVFVFNLFIHMHGVVVVPQFKYSCCANRTGWLQNEWNGRHFVKFLDNYIHNSIKPPKSR